MPRSIKIVLALALLGRMTAAQTDARLEFDVASVKPSKPGGTPNSNFPLGPGDVYVPNGGFFSATNFPLITYIAFAYKIRGNQTQNLLPQLPGWVTTDPYDIQARAEGNPTKDQMRLMMRSLLADRFKLAIHSETKQVSPLALVLLKPGKTGPQLRSHPKDASCSTAAPPQSDPGAGQAFSLTVDGFPALCGGILGMRPSERGRQRIGARNVTMETIANSLTTYGNPGRPVLDQTGLTGTFDYAIEFTLEFIGNVPPGADFRSDISGPSFQEAVKEHLGLKLDSQKGPVEVLVLDHVERPSEN